MKLLETVKPVTNAKKAELERELEDEKARFKSTSQELVDAVRSGISVKELIEERPYEATVALIVGGFVLAHVIQLRRRKRRARRREIGEPDLP